MKPVLDGYADVLEVTAEAEEQFVQDLDAELAQTVFAAGCSNWYINQAGRNSAAWPGLAVTFWHATRFPKWADFSCKGGSSFWVLRRIRRALTSQSLLVWLGFLAMMVGGSHIVSSESLQSTAGLLQLIKPNHVSS